MTEAGKTMIELFLKEGIWIGSLGWLTAVFGWAVFVRRDGVVKSDTDAKDVLKGKVLLGIIGLLVGLIIAF